MLEIIKPPEDNMKVPIAEEGLTEEFQPIEEMGRLRSWRIQSAPLTKEEYIALKNELEKPGFLQVTGKFLHPNEEKMLYLKAKSEIISLNQERDNLQYSIEFRLKDAEGLYGGAQDVSPTYSTVVYTLKDNTGAPISGVDIEIYNIKERKEMQGTYVTLEDGSVLFVGTDDNSRIYVNHTREYAVERSVNSINWKYGFDLWKTISQTDLNNMVGNSGKHIEDCFDREKNLQSSANQSQDFNDLRTVKNSMTDQWPGN